MKNIRIIGLMALLAGVMGMEAGGCDSTSPAHSAQITQASEKVAIRGTVVFREGTGASATDPASAGFYGILADNGGQYEPENLDERFHTDGERISFTGTLDTTHLGEHRWGNPIVLATISEER